ncbi:hypothetical protein DOY81_010507 [Sarcophaga bullata]|nr:hypothetical protein DOY81_010507 [Sarcophaga bullata]
MLDKVKHVILVLSGKGGVGKSTVSTQLALALRESGLKVNTPPGTSDEHITVMECMREVHCDGAIIVTTPQGVALDDVRKEITFCKKTGIHILGIVENMSGFVCPHCANCTNIFSSEGGAELAKLTGVPHLGTVPIDPRVSVLNGTTRSVLTELPESGTAATFKELVKKITA